MWLGSVAIVARRPAGLRGEVACGADGSEAAVRRGGLGRGGISAVDVEREYHCGGARVLQAKHRAQHDGRVQGPRSRRAKKLSRRLRPRVRRASAKKITLRYGL